MKKGGPTPRIYRNEAPAATVSSYDRGVGLPCGSRVTRSPRPNFTPPIVTSAAALHECRAPLGWKYVLTPPNSSPKKVPLRQRTLLMTCSLARKQDLRAPLPWNVRLQPL